METDKNKMIKLNHIYCGNAIDILKTFDKESVDMCITSPPYYKLRLYLTEPVIYGGDPECEHDFSLPSKSNGSEYRNHLGPLSSPYAKGVASMKHKPGETNPGKEAWYKDEGGLGHYIHRGTTKSNILTDGVITDGFVAEALCSKCGAWVGSLGNEDTISRYITNLVSVFDEVWRVLSNTGSLFVNIADTYWGGGHGGNTLYSTLDGDVKSDKQGKSSVYVPIVKWDGSYKSKCLCLIPERFAIAMVDRGWILRQSIHWIKTNAMPVSAKDRFTNAHEYLYHFTKQGKYYFEQQFEPQGNNTHGRGTKLSPPREGIVGHKDFCKYTPNSVLPQGRNMRNVWTLSTQPSNYDFCHDCGKLYVSSDRKQIKVEIYTDDRGIERRRRVCVCGSSTGWVDHFASYPRTLIERPIRATCPEQICDKCGESRITVFDSSERVNTRVGNNVLNSKSGTDNDPNGEFHKTDMSKYRQQIHYKANGYSRCNCNVGFHAGTVLDLFMGSGTTALEAIRQGKHFIGIELSQSYVNLANARIQHFGNNPVKPKKVKDKVIEDCQLDMFGDV